MTLAMLIAVLLSFAVALGWVRLLLWQYRAPPEARSRPWRLAGLVVLQPICAVLLYLALFPPELPMEAGTLVVATRNAPQALSLAPDDRLITLPEAQAFPAAHRVPDLATALRRHVGTQSLRIVGQGLEARDHEAAHGVSIRYDPPPLPRGLVQLSPPRAVAPGAIFQVGGQANDLARGSAELIDPAGERVDAAALSASGAFLLTGTARVPGAALFRLRLRDARRALIEEIEVPVRTVDAPAPRVLLLAGAPGPEVKYLRRWASDAGLALHVQLNLGGGLQLGDAPLPLTATTLRRFDLVVLDERAWSELSAGERGALGDGLRGGLGILLRITGPLSEATRRQWRALGVSVSVADETAPVALAKPAIDAKALRARRGAGTPDALAAAADDEIPALTRRALTIDSADAIPMLRDAEGTVLAGWRAEGRGRVGLWALADSFSLVLTGQGDRFGEYWSEAFATLARARPGAAPVIDAQPGEQQRLALCDIAANATVVAPAGDATILLVDPASGGRACAAYWPSQSGWHLLRQGEDVPDTPFYVYPARAIPALRAHEARARTLSLVGQTEARRPTSAPPNRPAPSWLWFIAWLAASALLWWLERARRGRSRPDSVQADPGSI